MCLIWKLSISSLVHCDIINKNYEDNLRIFDTFFRYKSFGQLWEILCKTFIFSKNFNSEFLYAEVWLTYQNSKLLEREGKIYITLVFS